jgi:hypothetical protein
LGKASCDAREPLDICSIPFAVLTHRLRLALQSLASALAALGLQQEGVQLPMEAHRVCLLAAAEGGYGRFKAT